MHNGRLKRILVFTLNPAKSNLCPLSEAAVQILPVYEDRQSFDVHVDVLEDKKGEYRNIGYAELFGIMNSSRRASDALRNPTTGVVIASTVAGDACRLFANLIMSSIKSSKILKSIKPKGRSARPHQQLLRDFAAIAGKKDGFEAAEDFYFRYL